MAYIVFRSAAQRDRYPDGQRIAYDGELRTVDGENVVRINGIDYPVLNEIFPTSIAVNEMPIALLTGVVHAAVVSTAAGLGLFSDFSEIYMYNLSTGVVFDGGDTTPLVILGDDANNSLFGDGSDNTITGGGGNDTIDGAAGTDTAVFSGARSDYVIFTSTIGTVIVSDAIANRDGKDSLQNVEELSFGGTSIQVDLALVEPSDADNSAYEIYRFFNEVTGAHFFTTSVAERNSIIENLPDLSFEGNSFDSNATQSNGGSAVFRFFNTLNSTHFYTADANEAQSIRDSLSHFRDEGISYYAHVDDSFGGTELYRFYNTQSGSHFYTVNEAERDSIINTLGHFTYEGVAFYVYGA
ncbi:hypothetical protein J7481_26415 [Labrenzia sp. R4_2]|uniref:hypothetical protein n=1 Tax=Labrenzia sp. R4_2 TaxID=2821107 RepID=UPI001AD9D140|nr:hypothetical protein [Labrenzia sp. R4_2]MBO9423063.1 hypothetical protein [Labrenzia sp. R4_2]